MNNQFDSFLNFLKALQKFEVKYILVGGFATILHGMGRLTQDVDIFIEIVPENVEKLRNALHSLYSDSSINEITINELEDYPVIRYGTPNSFYIDIMARFGERFEFKDLKYDVIDYEGIKINVASPETLIQMKKNTTREKDNLDVMFLKEVILRKGK